MTQRTFLFFIMKLIILIFEINFFQKTIQKQIHAKLKKSNQNNVYIPLTACMHFLI